VLFAHKLGVSGLWIGAYALLAGFVEEKIISLKLFRLYQYAFAMGLLVMVLARNGDETQLGIHLIFPISLGILASTFIKGAFVKKLDERISNRFEFLSLGAFSLFGANDILFNLGLFDSVPIFPLGILAGQFLFILAVDRRILDTYRERDFLRQNLEQEVERKTSELKQAQAELLQSAKLASLGTLSAGLAHEINNSINYVNGALMPLEKLVERSIPEGTDRNKINKLFGVMKDGLNLTVEIIRSLRNFSGINQAKFNDLSVREVTDSVVAILRNKMRDKIDTKIEISDELQIHGSVVGLNQVFMNLISNAIDAMPSGGVLTIKARDVGDGVQVCIQDTGIGIPAEIKDRIFDPFFTTKEVGKGTGLGLHIVRKEVERHQGRITVDSELGRGTMFTLYFPKNLSKQDEAA
jgi:signal transduction histidine kinase